MQIAGWAVLRCPHSSMIVKKSVFAETPSQSVEEKVNNIYRDRCTNKGKYTDCTSEADQLPSFRPKTDVRSESKA
jgi:hypothetical protein